MLAKDWIRGAERAGWRFVRSRALVLTMRCGCDGCDGEIQVPLGNLGPIPEPCSLPHKGGYGATAISDYQDLVDHLRRRRRSLGLSQEDVTAASGLGDGHINKLEALHRIARLPTLQLWSQSLGLRLTLDPVPLPPMTLRTMQDRTAPLRITTSKKRPNDAR